MEWVKKVRESTNNMLPGGLQYISLRVAGENTTKRVLIIFCNGDNLGTFLFL